MNLVGQARSVKCLGKRSDADNFILISKYTCVSDSKLYTSTSTQS